MASTPRPPRQPRLQSGALGGRLPGGRHLLRSALALLFVAAALAALYMLWLRDSSFVAIEEVRISGLESRGDLDASLRAAALEQTTLNVDQAALLDSIATDPAVVSVSADADFPRAIDLSVELRKPVAYLPGEGAVVAADGVVLERSGKAPEGVVTLRSKGLEGTGGEALGGEALQLARLLGAAPAPLLAESESVRLDETYGIVVTLAAGIELRFGSSGQLGSKWRAASAVLADPKLEGAEYLDLSVPARPVAGGLPVEQLEEPVAPVPADEAVAESPPAVAEPAPAATQTEAQPIP